MKHEDWCFEGHRVRLYHRGRGPTLILLHGIGPGTSIPANFGAVIPLLAERFSLVGMDWIGFGGSQGKAAPPFFDPALWLRQARALVRRLGHPETRLWGQSIGGALALAVAADEPSVAALVTTGSGGGRHRLNADLDRFWTLPDSVDAMRAAMASGNHDPALATEALARERLATLSKGGLSRYFHTMMATDRQALLDAVRVPDERLRAISARVLMIHGREDKPVPAGQNTLYLQARVKHCDTLLLSACGHNPCWEHPRRVAVAATRHLLGEDEQG
ncbi:alpha/beta fold hydrolase [Alloalcanivorax marinus]|uniref:alpha/beta fold hydrolase n=1 Tax=Alloalcanivorax marinus TaxID=1177169 RepID=UPI001932FC01|nr:alpha/beta hydrolase [Alloalcanivorax marinus]MBL7249599.1 alpha/beta hydrolase [Alloalcanivorax marinus]